MSEEKKIRLSELRIELLRYFKECKEDDSLEYFGGKWSENQLRETFLWLSQAGYITNCGDLMFKLNEKGLELINLYEAKTEDKKQAEITVTKKEANSKWWDRNIDNLYKIIGIPILLWTLYLQYTQVGNSADIRRLQEKLKADSIQFSTTLDSLENQLTRHDTLLRNIRIQKPADSSKSP